MTRIARQNLWEGIFITALVLSALAVIVGCSAEQVAAAREAVTDPGTLGPVIAAVPALAANPADPVSWTTIFTWIGGIAGTAVAGWFGVKRLRK